MRFYNMTKDDKLSCINRCYFEADHGNLYDALKRIKDLKEEFPNDPKVFFAEGSLRRDFLGQGIIARELFEKAYNLDHNHVLALFNVINLSSDELEFRKWAEILLKSNFNHHDSDQLKKIISQTLKEFDSGLNHFNWLIEMSNLEFQEQSYGTSASKIEIALNNWDYSYEIDPIRLRRMRAEALRMIDKKSDTKKVNYGLTIPPTERLSLQEAFNEIEKAIELDEYDAELWNLKSAWSNLLGKPEEAIEYAEKSIKFRPYNYPKPYHNLAIAYINLKKFDDALEYAEKAKLEAESAKSPGDIKMADAFIKNIPLKKRGFQLKDLEHLANLILIYVHKFSEKNINQYNLSFNDLSSFILKKINKNSSSWDYINIMAEMLSTFPPETVFKANLNLFDKGKIEINEKCLIASLYIASNSQGIQRSDAAKFIVISILANFKVDRIREIYRKLILAPSEAANNELSQLSNIMIQEINRIGIVGPEYLNEMIVKQAPINHIEIEFAQKNILNRFTNLNEIPEDIYLLLGCPENPPGAGSLKLLRSIKRFAGNRKRL